MDKQVIITDHAYARAKERLSFSKKALDRIAQKAFDAGIKHNQTVGSLKKYIDSISINQQRPGNVIIHGTILFVFKDIFLITVYQLPTVFVRASNKIARRLKRQREKEEKTSI